MSREAISKRPRHVHRRAIAVLVLALAAWAGEGAVRLLARDDQRRALLLERCRPGLVHSYQAGAKYDPLEPGNPDSIDKGGCTNLLTPSRMVSKNAPGMANNSCLVEITKWEV